MRAQIQEFLSLSLSPTAKTTYFMFAGNVTTAILAFVIIAVAARSFEPTTFGLFFALYNLIQLVSSIADLGLGSGIVNFIPKALSNDNHLEANQYLKAGWDFILATSAIFTVVGILIPFGFVQLIFPGILPLEWIATVLATTSFVLINFIIFAFQARKEFLKSIAANTGYSFMRMLLIVFLSVVGRLDIFLAIMGYAFSSLIGVLASLPFLPSIFGLKYRPSDKQRENLLRFSSHLGLGKIAANLASRIDVGLLYPMAGAFATAQYGIAQRVAFLYVLFSSSAGAVITPKIASITKRTELRAYARKIILLSGLLVLSLVAGIIIADPLIPLLFGEKYITVIPVVRWMLIATIPFLLNMTPVNLVIYFQKNSKLIGILSVIQLIIVVLLNWFLIPKFGAYGSIIAYATGNIFVGIVTWYKVRNIL
ncbi:MAG: Polysaccharide biosynthesis protein [Microgenomates group bacterium GW2011_GWA2_44_7]|nr:MAG: Polysaccharide biosynthesis protein [Microgenomates group bacterium GW2011_GWA2_44_7]KKT78375.1 MAG: Polysaccharide biosynthesis protein [Microgenomates group bacterium GW2011_GWB1_44_8]